ncbi:MAG: hypothetical protein AAF438_19130, partial [Pseudomonadota bacterium]
MNHIRFLCLGFLLSTVCNGVLAQTRADEAWWPSQWGPDDEKGATNRITPEKVLEATKLIKKGQIYELGRVYEAGMPLFPGRHYSLTIPGSPTGGPAG